MGQVRDFFSHFSRHQLFLTACVACLLTVLIFPDIVFMGAHIRLTDQLEANIRNGKIVSFYPHPDQRHWWDAYNDNGGAVWQSEPMMEFIRRSLWRFESPYWNPYSSAGSLGPETLVDEKLSYISLAYSLLGGHLAVFDAVYLFSYATAAFFIIRVFREILKLSWMPAVTAAVFYLLNGYSSANIASNVTESYLVIPACIFFGFRFFQNRNVNDFCYLTLVLTLLLSCTFLPTTIVSLLTIFCLFAAYQFDELRQSDKSWRFGASVFITSVGALAIAGAVIAAPIYLPFLESVQDTSTHEFYKNRHFFPLFWPGLLTLFSSSHFFEAYSAIDMPGLSLLGQTAYHFGVIPIAIAASVAPVTRRYRALCLTCIFVIVLILSRIFHAPVLYYTFEIFPIIKNLGCQYLWSAAVISMTILIALGLENLIQGKIRLIWPFAIFTVGIGVAIGVGRQYGWSPTRPLGELRDLWWLGLTVAAVLFLLIKSNRSTNYETRLLIAQLLTILCFFELTSDAKLMHIKSKDYFVHPPPEVAFLQNNIGQSRTMTIGTTTGAPPEQGSAFHIPEISSLNLATLPEYNTFFHKAIVLDQSEMWMQLLPYADSKDPKHFDFNAYGIYPSLGNMVDHPDKVEFDWSLLNLMGVKYIVTPASYLEYVRYLTSQGMIPVYTTPLTRIYENPKVMPHAFSVDAVQASAGNVSLEPAALALAKPITISKYHNATVKLEGDADASKLIVLTDNWHRNWRAWLNGKNVPILKIDNTFRGIEVPPGHYSIIMRYRPVTLIPALILSSLGLLAMLIGMIWPQSIETWLRRRKFWFAKSDTAGDTNDCLETANAL